MSQTDVARPLPLYAAAVVLKLAPSLSTYSVDSGKIFFRALRGLMHVVGIDS